MYDKPIVNGHPLIIKVSGGVVSEVLIELSSLAYLYKLSHLHVNDLL